MFLPFCVVAMTQTQVPTTQAVQPIRILSIMGKILSVGGPLQFDEKGIRFLGEENSKSDGSESYNGIEFRLSPDYWAMVEKNRKECDAKAHIKVEKGRLLHDGKKVDFGVVKIKWVNRAVFWGDWVIGVGLTSKEEASLHNLEPRELIYYNWKTLNGGSIHLVNKSMPEFKILTK